MMISVMNDENSDLEEFKKSIELQEKMVNEKINPILRSYKDGQIDRKEFIEKLIEVFYGLEDNNV